MMEITIGLWVIPLVISVGIYLWISYGFDYSGSYNFTALFTLPLWAFLTSFVWMVYFAVLYFSKGE